MFDNSSDVSFGQFFPFSGPGCLLSRIFGLSCVRHPNYFAFVLLPMSKWRFLWTHHPSGYISVGHPLGAPYVILWSQSRIYNEELSKLCPTHEPSTRPTNLNQIAKVQQTHVILRGAPFVERQKDQGFTCLPCSLHRCGVAKGECLTP